MHALVGDIAEAEEDLRHVDVGVSLGTVRVGRVVLVTEAEVQGQVRADSPDVVDKERGRGPAHLQERRRDRVTWIRRVAEEVIGDARAASLRVRVLGHGSVELEFWIEELVADRVKAVATPLAAEAEGVLS